MILAQIEIKSPVEQNRGFGYESMQVFPPNI
jgi:hypothetical protein